MAMLEDVLVPAYLFHRYQLEAVTKMVGGMYYTYALRGDGQVVTRALTRDEQLRALHAVVDCMDPKLLVLPASIIKLIPPRPAGYNFTRELFKKRTGLAFDALAPAETAADFPLSFLFNSERLSRMAQYAIDGGLGVHEMLRVLIDNTWKAARRTGMEGLVQLQTEQVLLTYLLALTIDENASFAARAAGQKALADLKAYIEEKQKTATDESYAAHCMLALERMKAPEKAKPTIQHKEMPPGAPIGCDADDQIIP
jgi:Met-zincin